MKKPPAFQIPTGLHFATQRFPRYTVGLSQGPALGVPFNLSPYYWWFRLLQLNSDFADALDGKRTKISKQVLKDFGDVRGLDFYDWWNSHASLFSEPVSLEKMQTISKRNEIDAALKKNVAIIAIPLDWSNTQIKKSFTVLVNQLVPSNPKHQLLKNSQAKYRLSGKWSIKALAESCRVLQLKREADAVYEKSKKKTAWADIGIKAKLSYAVREKMTSPGNGNMEQRSTLTTLTIRAYSRAQKYLASSVTTSFPT